ncbi:MAG: cobalamin B12-binding domain-containing protein [Planctomycetota bacterium]|jgi:methanogenic corrinoid protein MtbC1
MKIDSILERYLDVLLSGDRKNSRIIVEEALQSGIPANAVYMEIIWPIMVELEKLVAAERISQASEHMAVRINRTIVDQLQNKLPRRASRDKKIAICCAPSEINELGAQIMADLFESDGWEVKFLGGGLTSDDILGFVNRYGPDVLLIYGTNGKQVPEIRNLIRTVRSVNAWPDMRIMVSGGVFNRAEGLWERIEADLFSATAQEALQVALGDSRPEPDEQVGTGRRRKRRKKVTETSVS